jgi:predicted SAM-dependent methyltransferase
MNAEYVRKKFRTLMKILGLCLFRLPLKLKKTVLYSKRHQCPVCENYLRLFLPAGAVARMNARCPICGALERHRLDWIFLRTQTNLFDGSPKRMLHVAPEPAFESKLKAIANLEYTTADLNDPNVMVKMDVSDIKYPEDHFDVIYCSNVLEHVLEDRKAMNELFRVLRPGGWAMLLVPISTQPTFEDATVTTPEEREKLFGGGDHFRAYGPDYIDRLETAGFEVQLFEASELLDRNTLYKFGIRQHQRVVFCAK